MTKLPILPIIDFLSSAKRRNLLTTENDVIRRFRNAKEGNEELHVEQACPSPEPDVDRHEETPEGVLPNPLHEPGLSGPEICLCQILTHLCEIKHVWL